MTTRYVHNILFVNENNLPEALLSELEPCRIYKAKTGSEAILILANESIDVIVIDLHTSEIPELPELSGFELAEHIRSNNRTKNIPVVFLTEVFRPNDFIQREYRAGTISCLIKPPDNDEFLNRMNLCLRLSDKEKILMELNDTLDQHSGVQTQNRQKNCILTHQARLASMSEMIIQIAHHWRQPINTIGLLIQDILDAYDFNELNREYISNNVNKCMEIIEKMSNTIDEFRGFYKTDPVKAIFGLRNAMEKAVSFIEPILIEYQIAIEVNTIDAKLLGYPVEFGRVIVSLVNNAKDAIMENDIENPVIKINSFAENGNIAVVVTDNGGGVPPEIAGRIFDPYFTTKEEGCGTGLGLYTSKYFIERHMGGTLSFKDTSDGAEFKIVVPSVPGS
ncbi:MAG: hybrid sensor histidine kinase/response regulator [Nitrospirae bacterium]|nr:hybrid sensor histidine kinase/response regulator [Nitrospirota bacterium]